MFKKLLVLLALNLTGHAQIVLVTGDVELSANFNSSLVGSATNPWLITLRDGPALREYAGARTGFSDPERVRLRATDTARIEVPDDSRYAFLGAPGRSIFILPEATDDGLLTPGVSTENRTAQAGWQGIGVSSAFLARGVPASTFLNDRITLTLTAFSGPGNFFLYRTNGFGDPLISLRTDDGLDASDARNFTIGTHTHFNWAFTAPGDYFLSFRGSGTLLAGGQLSQSDVTTFHFQIVPEPGAALTLIGGLLALALRRHRRRA